MACSFIQPIPSRLLKSYFIKNKKFIDYIFLASNSKISSFTNGSYSKLKVKVSKTIFIPITVFGKNHVISGKKDSLLNILKSNFLDINISKYLDKRISLRPKMLVIMAPK